MALPAAAVGEDRHPVTGEPPDYYYTLPGGDRLPRWRNPMRKGEDPRRWYFTTQEVAQRLGVTSQTVRNWIATGKLAAVQPERRMFVQGTELERFLRMSARPYG